MYFRFYERQLFCCIRNVKYEIQMIEDSLYSRFGFAQFTYCTMLLVYNIRRLLHNGMIKFSF